jgi:ribosomal protein L11
MLALLIAAALAAASPPTQEQIKQESLDRAEMCLQINQQIKSPDDAIKQFKLDTPEKEKEFVIGCNELFIGLVLGHKAAEGEQQNPEDTQ